MSTPASKRMKGVKVTHLLPLNSLLNSRTLKTFLSAQDRRSHWMGLDAWSQLMIIDALSPHSIGEDIVDAPFILETARRLYRVQSGVAYCAGGPYGTSEASYDCDMEQLLRLVIDIYFNYSWPTSPVTEYWLSEWIVYPFRSPHGKTERRRTAECEDSGHRILARIYCNKPREQYFRPGRQ